MMSFPASVRALLGRAPLEQAPEVIAGSRGIKDVIRVAV